jgi:hypothetical protein
MPPLLLDVVVPLELVWPLLDVEPASGSVGGEVESSLEHA